mgnify:FL=1|jgi:signal peptidase I
MQKFLKEYLPYIIIIIIVILVKIFFITPVRVKGVSMNNTLKDKDIMLLNKAIYRHQDIKRFDIIVIKMGNEEIIKRVIGLPGDEVVYKNNKLYINNKLLDEDFNKVYDINLNDYNTSVLGSSKVPKNHYFVLGDNRPKSADSRLLGFISQKDIVGKAEYIVLPPKRWKANKLLTK